MFVMVNIMVRRGTLDTRDATLHTICLRKHSPGLAYLNPERSRLKSLGFLISIWNFGWNLV